jgi:hypothetical protein
MLPPNLPGRLRPIPVIAPLTGRFDNEPYVVRRGDRPSATRLLDHLIAGSRHELRAIDAGYFAQPFEQGIP